MQIQLFPMTRVAVAKVVRHARRGCTELAACSSTAGAPAKVRKDPRAAERARSAQVDPAPLRIAVLDSDSGFLVVLAKRLERLEWSHRVLASTASRRASPRCASTPSSSTRRSWARAAGTGSSACATRGRSSASSSARAHRRSRSASAPCGWALTTGCPSRATRRSSSPGSRPSWDTGAGRDPRNLEPVTDRRGGDPPRPVPGVRGRARASG